MTTTTSTYRVSINFKDKVILLTKPLKECEYFNNNPSYIDKTYTFNNETIKVHHDVNNYRQNHYTSSYKTARKLFLTLKNSKKNYFFFNTLAWHSLITII